jgi:transposase InsO family protein
MKGKVPWTPACQTAFDNMKALLAKEAFLAYPDHNKPFHIYADASDLQLGAAIFQDSKPVAFYSRKLDSAQRNYTVGEKELLSVVATLKEFHSLLYGCPNIHVYTDHKNNTFAKFQTQRVLRWRLFLEDFGVQFHYIKGESNSLADALSRLPLAERQNPTDSFESDVLPSNPVDNSFYSMAIDDDNLLDCFIHLPQSEDIPFVLDYNTIRAAQAGDARLAVLRQTKPASFVEQLLAPNVSVTCYIPEPNAPWKIYLPTPLLQNAVLWYHYALGHLGQNRLYDTMAIHLYHPDLKNTVTSVVTKCDICQKQKQVLRGHGHTAPREANAHPWRSVAVDLVGPWKLSIQQQEISFTALTIIDTVTNLVELVRIDNKTAAHVALQFENTWLSRYPKPFACIHDQGGEFVGYHFKQMLSRQGIKDVTTTSKNPQANAICERMHQSVGNTLRSLISMNPPDGIESANRLVDTALATCTYATRTALHGSLQASPGSLAFGRDMILDIPMIADWVSIQQNRQQLIDQRLIAANRKRFAYDYQIGDEVLKLVYKPDKLSSRTTGPYKIETVHTNGTVTIQLTPHTIERISIRRIKPYHR